MFMQKLLQKEMWCFRHSGTIHAYSTSPVGQACARREELSGAAAPWKFQPEAPEHSAGDFKAN
jgi:hypothetical protein